MNDDNINPGFLGGPQVGTDNTLDEDNPRVQGTDRKLVGSNTKDENDLTNGVYGTVVTQGSDHPLNGHYGT
jgi:hypothetical protein